MLLAGYVEPREKVAPDAARGVVICKEGRSGGWSDSLRLAQGDREFRQRRWLIPLPGHLERQIGAPASLKEGVRSGRWLREGGTLRGSSQRNTDLHDGTQLRYLRMLKELWANAQVCTDSHKARPKAESQSTKELGRVSGHVNFHRA